MDPNTQQISLTDNLVASKIYHIRDKRVMIDKDLAELYEVETRVLNQAVRRNIERFPHFFMFQLTQTEFDILKSQIVISSWVAQENKLDIKEKIKSNFLFKTKLQL